MLIKASGGDDNHWHYWDGVKDVSYQTAIIKDPEVRDFADGCSPHNWVFVEKEGSINSPDCSRAVVHLCFTDRDGQYIGIVSAAPLFLLNDAGKTVEVLHY